MKSVRRSAIVAFLTGMFLLFGTGVAEAAQSYSRSVTGAYGYGSISFGNGNIYTVASRIKDTRSDGECAYVVFRPQVQYSRIGVWLSVGLTGYEVRKQVCGYGTTLYSTVTIDVDNHMSALDESLATANRLYIRVCRNVNNAGDPCSNFYGTPHAM